MSNNRLHKEQFFLSVVVYHSDTELFIPWAFCAARPLGKVLREMGFVTKKFLLSLSLVCALPCSWRGRRWIRTHLVGSCSSKQRRENVSPNNELLYFFPIKWHISTFYCNSHLFLWTPQRNWPFLQRHWCCK